MYLYPMYISIPDIYQNKRFHYFPQFGILSSHRINHYEEMRQCDLQITKVINALDCVNNPYMLKSTSYKELSLNIKNKKILALFARILVWSHKNCYILEWILSHLRLNAFSNAIDATSFFCNSIDSEQKTLCMPRSIFAATTSRKFKDNGVMLIGVFHPTRHMHAWIIEDGIVPYFFDNIWINYSPVSIMV